MDEGGKFDGMTLSWKKTSEPLINATRPARVNSGAFSEDGDFDLANARHGTHHGGGEPKVMWIAIAVVAWLIFYFAPVLKQDAEPALCTGTLVFQGFDYDSWNATSAANPGLVMALLTNLASFAGPGVNLSDVTVTSIHDGSDASNSTQADFTIGSLTWSQNCSTQAPDRWGVRSNCGTDEISANIFSALHDDSFSIGFLRQAAHHGVHIYGGIPGSFDSVALVGSIAPGATRYDMEDVQRCLALLVLVCILWASEAVPLWVTSMLIPIMIVFTNITLVRSAVDGTLQRMSAADSAKEQLANFSTPNVILLMGGLTIAAALHKYHLDARMALQVLKLASNPKLFILLNMVVGFVTSMFCNNVAAPVLCFFLITPVLHQIKDRAYCSCMVMSIAFACNIGGMPTPIASPQNAAALQAILSQGGSVDFLTWMWFSLPFCVCLLVFTWLWMLYFWKPQLQTLPPSQHQEFEPFTWRHWLVLLVTVTTVLLWVTFQLTAAFFGSLGVIGLLPVILLYGSGTLDGDDFKRLDWNVLMLLGGGAALGEAVESSGLLNTLADNISGLFGTSNSDMDLWKEFMFFNLCVVIVTNFISHTVGAITMMPVIAKVGAGVTPSRVVPLVLSCVLLDSAACALPVSSFPNVIAFGLRDENGKAYLQTKDYLLAAGPIEIAALLLMASLGWEMQKLL